MNITGKLEQLESLLRKRNERSVLVVLRRGDDMYTSGDKTYTLQQLQERKAKRGINSHIIDLVRT